MSWAASKACGVPDPDDRYRLVAGCAAQPRCRRLPAPGHSDRDKAGGLWMYSWRKGDGARQLMAVGADGGVSPTCVPTAGRRSAELSVAGLARFRRAAAVAGFSHVRITSQRVPPCFLASLSDKAGASSRSNSGLRGGACGRLAARRRKSGSWVLRNRVRLGHRLAVRIGPAKCGPVRTCPNEGSV